MVGASNIRSGEVRWGECLPPQIMFSQQLLHDIKYYDKTEEFNVVWKAVCERLNLAHETKTNKRQCTLSSVQVQDPWRQSGRNEKTIEERICEKLSFKSGVEEGESDRWWEWRWWLWWGEMRGMRWTRRRVNRMTGWRREPIPRVRWKLCPNQCIIDTDNIYNSTMS